MADLSALGGNKGCKSRALLSFALVMGTLLLGGCAHPRPGQVSAIAIPAYPIRATDHPSFPTLLRRAQPSAGALRYDDRGSPAPLQCGAAALADGEAGPFVGPASYLVLSGGSQNGAFGAGFFLGLQESGQMPAEPLVVTGVSTGSLQSTFLFLARQEVPKDRNYDWAAGIARTDPGGPEIVPGRSNVEDLAVAYAIRREKDILKPVALGGVGMLVNGTKGTFGPLRRRLLGLVSPETIHELALQACRGRKLLVGVADVDDGQAYALDMTALALMAYDGNATARRMDLVRKAYVEGLIASSSVPVGAKPVTLRIRDMSEERHKRHLFVDGGARFGVFLEDMQSFRSAEGGAGSNDGVTLIVNTRLTLGPWHDGDDPLSPRKGWRLTTLGLRTVGILENQVYRLSVQAVEDRAAELGGLHMAYIGKENIPGGDEPDAHSYRGKSCGAWHDEDEQSAHPIEFHPNYMACLTDYGRARGRAYQWNTIR